MKINKWNLLTIFTFIVCLLFIAGCGGKAPVADKKPTETKPSATAAQKQVYFATGTPGGVYQILGAGMAKIINEKNPGINLVATTPAQITQTPKILDSGDAMLGIGMACMMDRARKGEVEFRGQKYEKVVPIMGMYDNAMIYVTLKGSPINDFKQVSGKVFATTASNVVQIKALLSAAGEDPSKTKFRVMSYQQAAEALSDNNADVAVLTGYPKNGLVDSLSSTKGAQFLTIDQETRANFDKQNPLWKMMETPAGTYTGQTLPAVGPTYYTVLFANANADEKTIYNIVKTVIENNKEIGTIHPAGKDIKLETTKRYLENNIIDIKLLHPGAIKYFKEKGIIK